MTVEYVRIELANAEGQLRRLLGVIETRGWTIRSMQMADGPDPSLITLSLGPRDGTRRIDTLIRQIDRTGGVTCAERIAAGPPRISEMSRVAAG